MGWSARFEEMRIGSWLRAVEVMFVTYNGLGCEQLEQDGENRDASVSQIDVGLVSGGIVAL